MPGSSCVPSCRSVGYKLGPAQVASQAAVRHSPPCVQCISVHWRRRDSRHSDAHWCSVVNQTDASVLIFRPRLVRACRGMLTWTVDQRQAKLRITGEPNVGLQTESRRQISAWRSGRSEICPEAVLATSLRLKRPSAVGQIRSRPSRRVNSRAGAFDRRAWSWTRSFLRSEKIIQLRLVLPLSSLGLRDSLGV